MVCGQCRMPCRSRWHSEVDNRLTQTKHRVGIVAGRNLCRSAVSQFAGIPARTGMTWAQNATAKAASRRIHDCRHAQPTDSTGAPSDRDCWQTRRIVNHASTGLSRNNAMTDVVSVAA